MEIIIQWSELATKQLNEIYLFYSSKASPTTAKKIVLKIIDRVEILLKNPLSGPKEHLLSEMPEEFRYLVESNYKIIYWVEDEIITIASVFDCRQNPEKMKIIVNPRKRE